MTARLYPSYLGHTRFKSEALWLQIIVWWFGRGYPVGYMEDEKMVKQAMRRRDPRQDESGGSQYHEC